MKRISFLFQGKDRNDLITFLKENTVSYLKSEAVLRTDIRSLQK